MTVETHTAPTDGLPPLNSEELSDASFRAKDLAWSALLDLFGRRSLDGAYSYETLGKRVKRSRAQIHRWLGGSRNMTLSSLGLLAEGMDADIDIILTPRDGHEQCSLRNYAHPAVRAQESLITLKVGSNPLHISFVDWATPQITSSSPTLKVSEDWHER